MSVWEHQELGRRISNWGRWGADDQLGTLNFVTDEKRREAAACVRTGVSFDLGLPFGATGPQEAGTFRANPIHVMTSTPLDNRGKPDGQISSDDMITMHLQCSTQWDGLAHVGYDERFYNDMPATDVTTKRGAVRNGFEHATNRLITRGVLLDIAALKGVSRLEPDTEITGADLSAAQSRQGVEVRPGDMLLVRTGHSQLYTAGDRATYMGAAPGLGWPSAEWLREREVAGVAVDNWSCERWPSIVPGSVAPFHQVAIRDVGLVLGEMFVLEELAARCDADGVWDFLFSGTGLKIPGSVGSPVSPIAVR